jgi:predicted metal-dependent phosphoesterase TrpH
MVYDFHTHTALSDGDLSPIEFNNYNAVALTDHAATGSLARIIQGVAEVCDLAPILTS